MTSVLIIDADARIRHFLRTGFEFHGFSVMEADTAAGGLRAVTMNALDLLILALELPDVDGAEVIERVRSWSNIPIIVISTQTDEQQKVRLLGLGADDYVVKPFGISELLARGKAVMRRQRRSTNQDPVVRAGPLAVDLVSRLVTLEGRHVQLTRKEHALLRALAAHAGLVLTHQQLIREVWGSHAGNVQYLRILVRKLRQKVEREPARPLLIVRASGIGYRLDRAGGRGDVAHGAEPPRPGKAKGESCR